MSLSSTQLVGYLRAEFAKAQTLRNALFVVQLLAALPGAAAVLTPDQHGITQYVLAISGAVLLACWWLLEFFYSSTRSAAQAARRGALLLGGLNESLSPGEIQNLRERFTVTATRAAACEKTDYYATQKPVGAARLAEMLEESALYSERLQWLSANAMLVLLLLFAAVFAAIALSSITQPDPELGMLLVRVMLAMTVFVLSSDALGAQQRHRRAAISLQAIRQRLLTADRSDYPLPDVLLIFADYNAAVESAPESVPFLYRWYRADLNQRWQTYQHDRAVAREAKP